MSQSHFDIFLIKLKLHLSPQRTVQGLSASFPLKQVCSSALPLSELFLFYYKVPSFLPINLLKFC